MRTQLDITADSTDTAVDALAQASDLPKQRIKDAMAKGACWWMQKGKKVRLRKAKRERKSGSRIELFYDDQVLSKVPEPPTLVQDLRSYSIWFQPHGLLCQGSQRGAHGGPLRRADGGQ